MNIHHPRCGDVLQIGEAGRLSCLFSSTTENWEENRRQNGDDSYDDEELDECESLPFHPFSPPFFLDFKKMSQDI